MAKTVQIIKRSVVNLDQKKYPILKKLHLSFFFFWKATHSLFLALALGFLFFFFSFVFLFGLRRLESSVELLGLHFWTKPFFFFFFTCGLAGWVTISEGAQVFFFFFLKINLLKIYFLFFIFLHVGWLVGLQFQRGPKLKSVNYA